MAPAAPRRKQTRQTAARATQETQRPRTEERHAFVEGLVQEMREQFLHYRQLVAEIATIQARLMIVERTLHVTRDHADLVLKQTQETVPGEWRTVLQQVRFVGTRLGEACVQIIRAHDGVTTQEILDELQAGHFRFHTTAPLREVHGALLRQPHTTKDGECWRYSAGTTEETR